MLICISVIITRAPFRISLGGGGTDLPSYYSKFGSKLISVAIDKYMVTTANRPVTDNLIRLKYSHSETVESLKEIQHELIRETLKLTNIKNGIELSFIADIPAGTGMGSSGSFLVSMLKALHTFKREEVTQAQIAEEACDIEINKLKEPVGKQDQYIAAHGGITQLIIDKKGRVEVVCPEIAQSTIEDLDDSLLLFYTGIQRSSSQVLSSQNKATQKGDKKVVDSLHFIKEIGEEITKALLKGDIKKFGKLLNTHWEHKLKLSGKVSNAQINNWYQKGIEAGALGGKLIGAGGGGFLLFCIPGDKKGLRKVMMAEGLREVFFRFDFDGVKVVANF